MAQDDLPIFVYIVVEQYYAYQMSNIRITKTLKLSFDRYWDLTERNDEKTSFLKRHKFTSKNIMTLNIYTFSIIFFISKFMIH